MHKTQKNKTTKKKTNNQKVLLTCQLPKLSVAVSYRNKNKTTKKQTYRNLEECLPDRGCDLLKLATNNQYRKDYVFTMNVKLKNAQRRDDYDREKRQENENILEDIQLTKFRKDKRHITGANLQEAVQGHKRYCEIQQQRIGPTKNFIKAVALHAFENQTELYQYLDEKICHKFNTMVDERITDSARARLAITLLSNFSQSQQQLIKNEVCKSH